MAFYQYPSFILNYVLLLNYLIVQFFSVDNKIIWFLHYESLIFFISQLHITFSISYYTVEYICQWMKTKKDQYKIKYKHVIIIILNIKGNI